MKRLTMISVIAVLALLLSFTSVFAADEAITVYLDGEEVTLTTDAVLESGRTLVPFRSIFEAMGMEVDWNPETWTVTGSSEGLEIELTIDSATAVVNGEETTLDVAPTLKSGSTMIPLRFVAEAAGSNVEWVAATSQVKIWTVDESAEELMAKINEAGKDEDSIAMKMTVKAAADSVEDGVAGSMTMEMAGDVKVAVNGEKMEMAMIMTTTTTEDGETETMNTEVYYKDDVMYMIIGEDKVKLEMTAEEAAQQIQVQPIETSDIVFDDSVKGAKVEEAEGTYTLTLFMDPDFMNETLEATLSQSFSLLDEADLEGIKLEDISMAYGDITIKIIADAEYNMTAMTMITSVDAVIGEDTMAMDMEITMEITATGKDVTITFPTDLNSYQDFAEYLLKAAGQEAA